MLAAVADVPREAFLLPELAEFAYDDRPLPIGAGQTISQPYIVAVMAEALQLTPDAAEHADVLEIGTGSGYAAAVLARIPVGTSDAQELVRVVRISDTGYRREDLGPVVFVPLIGAAGWAADEVADRIAGEQIFGEKLASGPWPRP